MAAELERHRARRVRWVALLVLAIAGLVTVIALPGGRPHRSAAAERVTTTVTPTAPPTTEPFAAAVTVPPTTTPPLATTTTADPGALPQTTAFPLSTGAQFEGEMAALWRGVLERVAVARRGRPFFQNLPICK